MVRVIVAIVIYLAIIAFYLSQSGAPSRVHVAIAVSLAVGFLFPALAIGSVGQFVSRWKFVIIAVLVGSVVFDLLTSFVVAKAAFLDGWHLKYPLLIVGFGALLFIHAVLAGLFKRRVATV